MSKTLIKRVCEGTKQYELYKLMASECCGSIKKEVSVGPATIVLQISFDSAQDAKAFSEICSNLKILT